MATKPVCSIAECGKTVFCRKLCSRHYHRLQRYGDPREGGPARADYMAWILRHRDWPDERACLTWPFFKTGDGRAGYVMYRGRQTGVARAMCFEANGEPPTRKHHAAHSCGNGHMACVNPRHLRWATSRENQLDRFRDGTSNRGSRNANSRISEHDVRRIRQIVPLVRGLMSYSDVGRLFGITGRHVGQIISRQTWGWLK